MIKIIYDFIIGSKTYCLIYSLSFLYDSSSKFVKKKYVNCSIIKTRFKFITFAHVSKYCQNTLRPSPTTSQLNITQCRIVIINKLSWRIKSLWRKYLAGTLAESKISLGKCRIMNSSFFFLMQSSFCPDNCLLKTRRRSIS